MTREPAPIEFVPVGDLPTREAARSLIVEYLQGIAEAAAANYGLSLDIDAMVASDLEDRSKFYPPNGRFYLLHIDGNFVGVGCLRRLGPKIAEVQRMYVQPHLRGLGAGRRLVERLLDDAREMGCEIVRLESLKHLGPAHALYRSVGFVEIPPYGENSMRSYQSPEDWERYLASTLFMELRFDTPSSR